MHKRLFNEAIIELMLSPVGPILIKAGGGEADPTKPDMSFVRTIREGKETVYLPGSSLKGVLRAHCERLARTVDSEQRHRRTRKPLACDPLDDGHSCGKKLEGQQLQAAEKHKRSCFLCQLFGNTSLASHFRVADAYPIGDDPRTEERNGVAIDRVFGSVAVGPFNYETVTSGNFQTKLHLKNFTMAQIGLLALTLRDLQAERVRLGFAKSRGLGAVTAKVTRLILRYPLGEQLRLRDGNPLDKSKLYGVGAFVQANEGYGYAEADDVILPNGYTYAADEWELGLEVSAPRIPSDNGADKGVDWQPLGRACAKKWKEEVDREH